MKPSHPPLLSLFLALMAFQLAEHNSYAIKVSISVPELVKLNDAFWLNCTNHPQQSAETTTPQPIQSHQPQQQQQKDIYAIKWYKDGEEFYRFLPNASPRVSIYETNGIQLDKARSHEGNVYVNKADLNTEGSYRCEILSEGPNFEMVRKSKHLKVYALPIRGPRIEILDSSGRAKSLRAQEISYAVGDRIELRCNSAPSKPGVRLRWYLNDQELQLNSSSVDGSAPSPPSSRQRRHAAANHHQRQPHGYQVRVGPLEHRLHYKSIYSSHTTLSLLLQQGDLINNKISFKCLASMRQEVALDSKQLIVVLPSRRPAAAGQQVRGGGAANSARLQVSAHGAERADEDDTSGRPLARNRRQIDAAGAQEESRAHVQHRQRAPHLRHSFSRLPSLIAPQQQQQQQQQQQSAAGSRLDEPISGRQELSDRFIQKQMLYIYEDSNLALSSSILDSAGSLDKYLATQAQGAWRADLNANANASDSARNSINNRPANYEFKRLDNLDHIQLLRDRLAKYKSSGPQSHRRLHGANFLFKSPVYIDELDSLRPIINWPPLDAGELLLFSPRNTIVAIPTTPPAGLSNKKSLQSEQKFILPPRLDPMLDTNSLMQEFSLQNASSMLALNPQTQAILLEKLLENLNCTCLDGAPETRLSWMVDELPLDVRDTLYYGYAAKPGSEHRASSAHSIGLRMANAWPAADSSQTNKPSGSYEISLQTILAKNLQNSSESLVSKVEAHPADGGDDGDDLRSDGLARQQTGASAHKQTPSASQVRFISTVDGSSHDRLGSSSSNNNVIQAASASQSSSAASGNLFNVTLYGSHSALLSICIVMWIMVRNASQHLHLGRVYSVSQASIR